MCWAMQGFQVVCEKERVCCGCLVLLLLLMPLVAVLAPFAPVDSMVWCGVVWPMTGQG